QKLRINSQGDLILRLKGGDVRHHKPVVYQEVNGKRKEIAGRYVLKGQREVGFRVAKFDASKPLVIDPLLFYCTYLGGHGRDQGNAIAVDSFRNADVAGRT